MARHWQAPNASAPLGAHLRRPLRMGAVVQRRGAATGAGAGPGWAFGPCRLEERQRRLLIDGALIHLGSRAFDLLLLLVQSGGKLLTKSTILDRVWPGVVVEENNLQVQVSTLRRVLTPHRDWIVTVPGRGYRFTAAVSRLQNGPADDSTARAGTCDMLEAAGALVRDAMARHPAHPGAPLLAAMLTLLDGDRQCRVGLGRAASPAAGEDRAAFDLQP